MHLRLKKWLSSKQQELSSSGHEQSFFLYFKEQIEVGEHYCKAIKEIHQKMIDNELPEEIIISSEKDVRALLQDFEELALNFKKLEEEEKQKQLKIEEIITTEINLKHEIPIPEDNDSSFVSLQNHTLPHSEKTSFEDLTSEISNENSLKLENKNEKWVSNLAKNDSYYNLSSSQNNILTSGIGKLSIVEDYSASQSLSPENPSSGRIFSTIYSNSTLILNPPEQEKNSSCPTCGAAIKYRIQLSVQSSPFDYSFNQLPKLSHFKSKTLGLLSTPNFCYYKSLYYCDKKRCFDKDKAPIPWKVVQQFDTKKYSVSCESFHDIKSGMEHPFDLAKIHYGLYEKSKDLKNIQSLRKRLVPLANLLVTCQLPKTELFEPLGEKSYLIFKEDHYSLGDLLFAGKVYSILEPVYRKSLEHLSNCLKCQELGGFFCEICNHPKMIFPYQLESVTKCSECGNLFHSTCIPNLISFDCPKCARIRRYHF